MNRISNLIFKRITPGIFRLLLALIVMVYHSVDFLTIGHYAVYVFFILSGYWIFKMYNEKYRKFKNTFSVYLLSRLYRILPVYFLILVISILITLLIPQIQINQKYYIVKNIVQNIFLLGLNNATHLFIVPAWSLDIEVQFYILAPLLVLISLRKNGIFYLILLGLTGYLIAYYLFRITNWDTSLTYLPFFLIGGLIYLKDIQFNEKHSIWCLLLALVILGFNYTIPILRSNYLLNKDASLFFFNYRQILNILLTILTVPFITINVRKTNESKNDQLWSSMSFIIYLLHWPLLLVYAITVKDVGILQKCLHLSGYYLLCWIIAMFISRYFDNYFEKKRKLWIKKQALSVKYEPRVSEKLFILHH